MIFVDDILAYFRNLGHAAEYGTLAQLNEQLTNVDYAASTDGMVAFVRLIGEQRTVDGYDQCDIAVHLSWLCQLDFDGETLLSTQEQAKDKLKSWINHIRGGNTVTVSDDARWQFGYDDFAENVAWVAVRVTLTAAAADCVPLSPEPPTPPQPEKYNYNFFCPQTAGSLIGRENPIYRRSTRSVMATMAIPPNSSLGIFRWFQVGATTPESYSSTGHGVIDETLISNLRNNMSSAGYPMTIETEEWLNDRIGWYLATYTKSQVTLYPEEDYRRWMLAAIDAMMAENKLITYHE